MLESIPMATDDDGLGILLDALNADDVDDFNDESKLPSLDSIAPAVIKVTEATRRESDLGGIMPWYLILDVVDTTTGEALRVQTSAAKPMAVIANLYSKGRLPALLEISKREKATQRGMHPLQVKVLAIAPAPDAPAAKARRK